jgi:catechol 2,3-dioxygenase-like lactoylglutathione lyase family enzyme
MPVQLNHTIAGSRDPVAGAAFMTEILGLPAATQFGPFQVVETTNGVSIDFMDWGDAEIVGQHYAFLVTEDEFDQIFGRIQERGLDYWADPHANQKGEINRHDGGRGCYFQHPDGHWLEIITRPYGSGS